MKMNAQYHGLTEAEARRLREMGGGNTPPPPITKSTGQIIRENVCTLFNLFNVLIAAALALVGAWSNLLFILIIALNTAIGIVQELHAKRLVEQIAVLTAPKARVLRDGEIRELPVEELVLGDVLTLERGYRFRQTPWSWTARSRPTSPCSPGSPSRWGKPLGRSCSPGAWWSPGPAWPGCSGSGWTTTPPASPRRPGRSYPITRSC